MATIRDLRRLVDEIRAFLESADQTNSAHLADLAARYATECRSVNGRLTDCADRLERGLFAEVRALAAVEPNLMQAVDVLAFPELAQWQERTATYDGVARAPVVSEQIKSSIQERVFNRDENEQKLLENLLRKHRRLALSQAPLRERLKVMRQVAEIYGSPSTWQDDIIHFEGRRAREMIDQAQKANLQGDMALLGRCLIEYESEGWFAPPAEEHTLLYRRLSRLLHECFTLPDLGRQIDAAARRDDVETALAFRNRWNEVAQQLADHDPRWTPPARLSLSLAPAFEWLEEQTFLFDLSQLEEGLRAEADKEQIAMFATRAQSHGRPLPQATAARLKYFERGLKRNNQLNAAVLISIVIAALVLTVLACLIMRETFLNG